MTQETIRALSNTELEQVLAWGEWEKKERIAKHKQETIAKIKEMAKSIDVGIKLLGVKGRPPKNNPKAP